MRKKHVNNLIKGAIIGAITSAVANLLTFNNLEPKNVLVGGIVGSLAYVIAHSDW